MMPPHESWLPLPAHAWMSAHMLLTAPHRDPAAAFLKRLRRSARSRRPVWPALLRGSICGLAAVALVGGWNMAFGDNLHAVQPGRVFRSSQMSPGHLQQAIEGHQIRTVVNLRGTCADMPWYLGESKVTHAAKVNQEDVCLSATRLPSPVELRRLIEVLDRTEYPILLHCRQGVDRTGLAAAAVKLLEPGVSVAAARRQLSLGFGYVPFNGTESMRQFFDLYEEWLANLKLVHAPELFHHWAQNEYCPGACRGWLEPLGLPADRRLPAERARTFQFRAHNTSVRNWRLTTANLQGFHLRYSVTSNDHRTTWTERAGLFDAVVNPGEAVDLTVGFPPLPPGAYELRIEMIDENQSSFGMFGID